MEDSSLHGWTQEPLLHLDLQFNHPQQPRSKGGLSFGRELADGGDFQIATDGNFHHRHLISAGQSIPFHDPKHVIPKAFVDEVSEAILKARKSPPKKRKPKVPDSAVDECEKAHEAADSDKKKVNKGRYDDMGWMSLVCRHDIPLFFANIDTPGEQQKYSVALILWFFASIPPNATATALYDIACVLEQSIELFDFLPANVVSRIQFVTTAMHAGLGLTDGEGVERMWARLRKLISLVRTSSRARRIWLTDHQLSAIAFDLRVDLADWIKRRRRKGVQDQGAKAKAVIAKCGMTQSDLHIQWDLQKSAQMSVRAHAPNKLKKELDLLLSLQGDLELVDKSIRATEASLSTSTTPEKSKEILKGLYESHTSFTDCIEALYASLNFYDSYPDLKGANLEFVRTLLLARDLKMNIRKQAIGSFFEWDRLDQAVGGRNQALGTKLHQQTRKAISRRAPALVASIKKFNTYCTGKLANMYDPECNIPLPLPLPTKLSDLQDDPGLMEDGLVATIYIMETQQLPWNCMFSYRE
ncbi:hypothetical protein CVT26_009395 [Gymnopilus dilepis]|uniref:Uncharacterized protein n=1 Tax=Gymnopilus dilepis TaxID=231916 RepID=A0A409YIG7_9AGAR|nr:hypothetical protein CVT26_009395 [Gymnopilus dilepis]